MRLEPLYGTTYKRTNRGPMLVKWVRWTAFTLVAIPLLYYGIHGYFWMMPNVADKAARLFGWRATP